MENLSQQTLDIGVLPADLMRAYRERLEGELGFIGKSRQMRQIKDAISNYAAQTRAVTIVGPEGNGRRTVAKAIHMANSDWWRSFVEADLSGVDEKNAMRFLFGHQEEHIFSSSEFKPGLISMASNSTLCLKNFDRYSKVLQKELCDAYTSRQFRAIYEKEPRPLLCRFIFTVQNAPVELKKLGYIEEDASAMLSEKVISIPPLSSRKDDIVPLAEKFVRDCCAQFGLPLKRLSKEAERWLKKAPWNRNVNQLKKSIYFACFNTDDGLLFPKHFALAHDGNMDGYQEKQLEEVSVQSIVEAKLKSFLGRLGEFEATHLHEAIMGRVEEPLLKLVMEYAKGNQIRASRMLGINRNTLRAKLNKYEIKPVRGNEED